MNHLIIFETITIGVPQERVYRRLGYRKNVTMIPTRQKEEVDQYIADARSLIKLQGTAIRMPIREKSPAGIVLPGDVVFESRQLSALLNDCCEVVLIGSTTGNGIMEAMEEDTAHQNLTRRVVLDAVASETVDASLDWIIAYFNQELRRENKALMQRRYSAGYGDFSLENQKTIHRLLELDRIGVKITASCILLPEKSVTAIAGVKRLPAP
ncbi:MAG: hypothetical protein Q7J31_10635 [Syntrophales bacterium]|nr:hypothetical protein [Syntrophales bacterium]